MRLTSGTGAITTTLACLIAVGSCHYGEPYVAPYVAPQAPDYHRPTKCRHLYGEPGWAWETCMGVGPK